MSDQSVSDRDSPEQPSTEPDPRASADFTGLNPFLSSLTAAVLEACAVQQTVHHQGVEVYRQLNHAMVDTAEQSRSDTDASAADQHARIDEQCQAVHESIEDSWARFDRVLADTVTTAHDVVDVQRELLACTFDLAEFRAPSFSPVSPGRATENTSQSGVELQTIEGIGPTYAARLRDAGIDTLDALATADPSIIEELNVTGVDVRDWIEKAAARTSTR